MFTFITLMKRESLGTCTYLYNLVMLLSNALLFIVIFFFMTPVVLVGQFVTLQLF